MYFSISSNAYTPSHLCAVSNWARVYYANLMSSPILVIMLALAPKERALLAATQWRLANAGPLALSCVVGAAMSHASYLLRSHAAATTAAVVGIVCKLLSVSINLVIWWVAGCWAWMLCAHVGSRRGHIMNINR